ncbi:hypothetical protein APV28_0814 [Comamonas testosteroni]|nr:hypothetical protein APV28_0814 [Comamonas testosteroni]
MFLTKVSPCAAARLPPRGTTSSPRGGSCSMSLAKSTPRAAA